MIKRSGSKINKQKWLLKQVTLDLVPIPDRQAQIHHFQEDFEDGNSWWLSSMSGSQSS